MKSFKQFLHVSLFLLIAVAVSSCSVSDEGENTTAGSNAVAPTNNTGGSSGGGSGSGGSTGGTGGTGGSGGVDSPPTAFEIAELSKKWTVKGVADFNSDNRDDIVLHEIGGQGRVAIWYMYGHNMIGASLLDQGLSATSSIEGVADFDGDGDGDILIKDSSNTTNPYSIWLVQTGYIVSASPLMSSPTPDWIVGAVGDLDNDGKADIIFQNDTTGEAAAWYMNGLSITSAVYLDPGSSFTIDGQWAIVNTGDFNGDGRADILWHNPITNATAVWAVSGSTVTGVYGMGTTTILNHWPKAVGDFDEDGKDDIFFQPQSNASFYLPHMWFMSSYVQNSEENVQGAFPSNYSVSVVAGDFDGDGDADLFFHDPANDPIAYTWMMNDQQVVSGAYLPLSQ